MRSCGRLWTYTHIRPQTAPEYITNLKYETNKRQSACKFITLKTYAQRNRISCSSILANKHVLKYCFSIKFKCHHPRFLFGFEIATNRNIVPTIELYVEVLVIWSEETCS